MIEQLYRRAYWDGKRRCRVIRVKSWRPWWGPYGLEWPMLLVDDPSRMTVIPVWSWLMLRCLLFGQPPLPEKEAPQISTAGPGQ